MSVEQTGLILAWVVIVLLAFAMSALARQLGRAQLLLRQPAKRTLETPVGSVAPATPALANVGSPVVLFFAEAGCSTCERLWPLLETLAAQHEHVQFRALYATAAEGIPSVLTVIPDASREFFAFGVHLTPYVVAIDRNGIVRFAEPVASDIGLQMAVFTVSSLEGGSRVA